MLLKFRENWNQKIRLFMLKKNVEPTYTLNISKNLKRRCICTSQTLTDKKRKINTVLKIQLLKF